MGKKLEEEALNRLAVDKTGRFLSNNCDYALGTQRSEKADAMIECMPSRILATSIIISKNDSYIRAIGDHPSFPTLSKYETKIKDIQISENPYVVEAIVLQAPNKIEVNTKTRGTVSVTDTLLEMILEKFG